MRIGFLAPLKAPDHPTPSGDRAMARLLLAALREGGHEPALASPLRTFVAAPDPAAMAAREAEADREAARVASAWREAGPPDLLLTYHSHYKAPDLLGPRLAARFGLPLAIAEGSHAAKRAAGPWARWHALNEVALRAADLHLSFTPRDARGLAPLVPPERIAMLPPFLAAGPFGAVARDPAPAAGPLRLATVAMMRPGDKARSYALLAATLARLPEALDWTLDVVGDGPERAAVAAGFAALPPGRIAWHGALPPEAVARVLAGASLYVWPGIGEAYGIAYLEAAAAGLPVLAMDCGGVDSVVRRDETGVLTPEGDVPAHAAALLRLAGDPAALARLGAAGRRMALEERTLARAASRLDAALARVRRA